MKTLVAVVLLLAACAYAQETYPAEYDNLDVDALIQDQERVGKFVACVLQDECTELAGKLREILLDALNTKCSKCTEIQKGKIRKAANYFIKEKPDIWKKIVEKYDSNGEHEEGFKKFLQEG